MKLCKKLMIVILIAGFLVNTGIGQYIEKIDGSWVGRVTDDKIRMRLTVFEDDESWGEWNTTVYFDRYEFTGLEFDRDNTFELKREAGTVSFSGKFSGSRGYGDFTFISDVEFREFLAQKEFRKLTDRKLLLLWLYP